MSHGIDMELHEIRGEREGIDWNRCRSNHVIIISRGMRDVLNFTKFITFPSNRNHTITFDSHLKTALNYN